MEIPGYTISYQIDENLHSEIYRAKKAETQQPVVIKILKTETSAPSDTARIRHEYELIRTLGIKGVVKVIDIIESRDQLSLVMEDFGGVPLKHFPVNSFDLPHFLDMGICIADILAVLHDHNISHRNINPKSILYNNRTNELKLTDFGIAAELGYSGGLIYNAELMEATLAYISPEQTGRMNCDVDYRTDFYSLGATFYEMLTGSPPFTSRDPMEVIHAHIARRPLLPDSLNPQIPEIVSRIVMKLLAKEAEERYQSGRGLVADLEECRRQIKNTGRVNVFEPGRKDVSLKFTMPRQLVGREKELELLLEAYERSAGGAVNIMLVTGEPGIGKSALVHEIDKHVATRQGIFISGKFEQLRRYVPYSAIIQAFQELARRLLAESDEQVHKWRGKLLDALGPNSRVITDIIPEIGLITGQQPEVPDLEPREARNRFKRVFKNFVKVFTDRAHPLVLFLDDLQWGDSDSIELLKSVASDKDQGYFFLIGAFRDNEVPAHHPVMLAFEEIRQEWGNIEMLHLEALKEPQINQIISGSLRCAPEDSAPLASVIQEKTLGNPFFVNQFLKDLYESREIETDSSGGWKWNLDSIGRMQVTENVVDFMAKKIRRLPAESLEIIKICACAGNRFDAWTLSEVAQKPINSLVGIMESLVEEEFFSRKGSFYTFNHDRIQEAAYSLLSANEKKLNHYHIGSLALANTPEEELFYKIFYIVDQLNEGRDLISSEEERFRIAELNFRAGRKAKSSTAYDAAVNYLNTGAGLLPFGSWQSEYSLTYELCIELMECRYMARDFKGAEKIFEEIIENAREKKDKARAYTVMIILYTNMRSPVEAIKLGLMALRLFDSKISSRPGSVKVMAELLKAKFRLRKMHPDEILQLPMMEDQERIACQSLMLPITTPAFYVNPKLFAMLTLKGANEILKHGLNNTAGTTVVNLATIIENVLGDYELGYRLGKTAVKLNEKLDNKNLAGPVRHVFAFFIQHWKKHAACDIDVFKEVYQLCLEAGNFLFAGHSVNAVADCRLMIGHRIEDILDEAEKYRDFIRHIKDPFIEGRYMENLQMARCLKAMTEDRLSLSGPEFDESAHLARLYREKNLFGVCYSLLYKTKLLYLYGEYKKALNTAEKLDSHIRVPVGTLVVPEHYFYYCLTLAVFLNDGSIRQRRRRRGIIRKYLRQMERWAKLCPENFGHKRDLIQAEVKAANGQFRQAARLYRRAVEKARENGYLNEEALSCERFAIFYLNLDAKEESEVFFRKAYQCYGRWGAEAKQKEMEERLPFLAVTSGNFSTEVSRNSAVASEPGSQNLDMKTFMQTFQAISSEIVLGNLLQKIMHISVSNAGAQRGFLILETGGKLTIESGEDSRQQGPCIPEPILLDKYEGLARSIVNYVWRSHEPVILANAFEEGPFKKDPYIKAEKCKSVLCMPILNKGRLLGIFYMENNLVANAFTKERLEILGAIASQAAISIENARLFEQATTDGLTQLYVHRYFQFFLDKEIERSRRYSRSCSIVIIDIDDFKHFNDTYGHQLGDIVLKQVADVLRANIRASDILARYGGEEFVLVLPETRVDKAFTAAEKLRSLVENIAIKQEEEKLRVTVSLGVAAYPDHASDKDGLIRAADNALYVSKRAGKNRVSMCKAQVLSR